MLSLNYVYYHSSWDRLPFITDVRDGSASTVPAWTDAYSNLIVANYGANGGCLDNDDGSSWYKIHHNVCVFGGHKGDFDGHSKASSLHAHELIQIYTNTDYYCLVTFCTWILTNSSHTIICTFSQRCTNRAV
jgi:hypothetical protein